MFPIIFQIGPLTIYSYGLMLALAVLVAGYFLSRKAYRNFQIKTEETYDLIFWVVLGGVVGSRLFFILLNLKFFVENPLEIIMVQHGGLAWQGGMIVGLLVFCFYTKQKKWPILKLADICVPYIALGQTIGRWGCFLNGCCYGKEISWGIWDPLRGVHAYPTQIFLSVGAFISFLILIKVGRNQKFHGQLLSLYFILESVFRFIIEFFRADHEDFFMMLSVFQIVCIVVLIGSLYGYSYLQGRRRL